MGNTYSFLKLVSCSGVLVSIANSIGWSARWPFFSVSTKQHQRKISLADFCCELQ